MKDFKRGDLLFSLCGLNCGLCAMRLSNYCPGCGGGAGNQPCAIARCGAARGVAYCFECGEYPCARYDGCDAFDSFIARRNMRSDMEKAKRVGLDAYRAEQGEKVEILHSLLNGFNDGRKKSFFCVAVNLLELAELRAVMARLADVHVDGLTIKEKAALAASLLTELADGRGIALKLNKKPRKRGEN